MQYLGKNKENEHKYIVSVIDEGDTFSIKFADGVVYDGYEKSEENLKTVSDVMEVQAQEASELDGYFKGRAVINGISTLVGTSAGAYAVNELGTSLCNNLSSVEPEYVAVATGVTVGIGAILGAKHIMANLKKIKEIKKFNLRNSMKEDLDNIGDYPHALTGIRRSVVELVRQVENPFEAIHSEQYTTKDLEKISQNIEREKTYQLKQANWK